ncbi:MAG: hypothetical protein JST22_04695 [Bacteroidetes bacterium]|nr:hypothetical protein [Bacteroidota bacterium]
MYTYAERKENVTEMPMMLGGISAREEAARRRDGERSNTTAAAVADGATPAYVPGDLRGARSHESNLSGVPVHGVRSDAGGPRSAVARDFHGGFSSNRQRSHEVMFIGGGGPSSAVQTAMTPARKVTQDAQEVTVRSITKSGPDWGDHGYFDWWVGFDTNGRSGWLVQEIVNAYHAESDKGVELPLHPLPRYWEAWRVDAKGGVTPGDAHGNDHWGRPGRGVNTRGHWSMTGAVYFTTTDPAAMGFTVGGARDAHDLLSTTTAPTGLGRVLVDRYADGVWDSVTNPPIHSGNERSS